MHQLLLKQLGLWIAGQALSRAPALRNFIGEIALMVAAVLAVGFIGGALLVGIFYAEYLVLTIVARLEHVPAYTIVWLTAACLFLASIMLLQAKAKRIMQMMDVVKRVQSPVSYYVDPILDSFINGYSHRPAPKSKNKPSPSAKPPHIVTKRP